MALIKGEDKCPHLEVTRKMVRLNDLTDVWVCKWCKKDFINGLLRGKSGCRLRVKHSSASCLPLRTVANFRKELPRSGHTKQRT